jgi:hypothetical protein
MAEGPFDQYLNQPYQPQRTPLSGLGGKTEGILNFGVEFLKGASQARARKFAEQEQVRSRNIQALTQMAQFAQQSGMAPAALQQFNQGVMQRLVGEIANADNGAKGKEQGGNPLFGMVKQFATNMVGGSVQKQKPLDEAELGNYFAQISSAPKAVDIERSANQSIMDAFTDLQRTNNGIVSRQALIAHPKFQSGFQELEQNGLSDKLTPSVQMVLQGVSSPEDVRYQTSTQNILKAFGPQQQAQPQVAAQPNSEPPVAGPPIASSGAVPPGAIPRTQVATPPVQQFAQASGQQQMPGVLTGRTMSVPLMDMKRIGITPREFVLYKAPGDFFEAEQASLPDGRTVTWRKGTNEEIDTGTATKQGYQSLDRLPVSAIGQTPEQIQSAKAAISTRISTSPVLNADDKKAAEAIAAAQFVSGDFKGATDAVDRFIAERERAADRKATEADRRADRQDRIALTRGVQQQGLALKYTNAIESTVPLKNYDTVNQYAEMMEQAAAQARVADNKAKGIADLNLIRGAAKITDPPSTVREGEQQTYNNAQGLLNKWKAKVEGGWMNGAVLDDSARTEFLKMAREIKAIQRKHAADGIGPKLRQAKTQGIPYQEILRESMWDVGEHVFGGKTGEPPKSGTGANPGWSPKAPKGF